MKKKTAHEASIEEMNRLDNKMLAERVKLLFGFCAGLIPYMNRFESVLKETERISNFAISAAPVITAFGGDYEAKHFEAELHRKRADALLNLIKTLDETEKERAEFAKKQAAKEEGRAEIARILGGL